MSVDLPEPETPVTHTNTPTGSLRVTLRRLLPRAPVIVSIRDWVDAMPPRRDRYLPMAGEILPRQRMGGDADLLRRSLRDDLAAVLAGARTHVDDVIGGVDRIEVVLDDDHAVAEIAQVLQRREQPVVVALVQSDRRLVENVHDAGQPRADLRSEPYPLRLAARERLRRAVEREVLEADVVEEREPGDDLLDDPVGDRRLLARQDELPEIRGGLLEGQSPRLRRSRASPRPRRP